MNLLHQKLYVVLGDDNDEIMKQMNTRKFSLPRVSMLVLVMTTPENLPDTTFQLLKIDVLNDGTDPVAINDYVYGQDSFVFVECKLLLSITLMVT